MSTPHDTPPPELAGLNPQDLLRAGLESAEPGPADPDVTVRISPSQMAGSVSSAQQELPLPEELTALLPGGAYQVEGFLGQGGMGAVYKGTQIRLRRPVAIKIMRRDLGRDYDFEARFEREAQAMAKLNHPNIVSVIDFGEAGPDYLYIVMELVDGADLMDVIRGGQMTQEMALSLLPQICDALQFAHDHGIIHRDIKPSNIMLTRDGRIKMADFGLAKRFDAESTLHTKTGTGMGTPDYAAPEQFDPGANIDHRADIYALGVMIYQMITGTLPRGAWKSPSERAPVAPQWDGIVTRAMQSDPADRYQHASEVKTDVSSIPLAGTAPAIRDAGSTASKPSRAPQTKRTLSTRLWIAAAALVMALGGSYFLGLGGPAAAGIQWRTIDFAQLSDADLIQGNTNTRRENGVLRLTKLDGWRLPDFKARNVAIRATVHWEVGSTDLKLRARGQPGKLMEADSMSVHFNDRLRAVGYTRKPYGEPYLEKFPGKPGMEDGRDIVLGLTLIGSKAFLLQNDRLVGMEDHIPIDAAGDASVQAVNVLIKKLEVASLDELSEAEALKLLNLSQPAESPRPTSSPASPRPTATSPVWIDQLAGFWQGATEQFGWRRNPDGAAQVITDLPAILYYTEKGTQHHFRDQAARATMRLGESPYIQIGVRRTKESGSPSASSYKVTLSAQNRYLRLSMDVSNSEERKLADIALPEGADLNASHTLEISAIGDVISVIFDGRTLYQQPHSGCESGYPFVAARRGAVVEKFEVANLDEAKPASAATAQPGTKATATGNGWTNLLPLIQPERDSVRGQWSMDKQGLNAKRAEWAFCKIPAQDPGTDYDLRFKVTRGEGSPVAMFFAFRRGKTGGYIPIDYLNSPAPAFADGLRWATIQNLTDKNVFHPDMIKAKRQQWLPRGKQCEVLLQVREKEVIVSVNGEEAFRWPADWSKIQQRGGAGEAMFAGMTEEPVFGVGVFNCEAVFHSIEMLSHDKSTASASQFSAAPPSQLVWNPLLGPQEWQDPRTPGVENIGGVLHLKDSATVLTRPQPGLDGGGATKSEEQTVPTNASSAGPSVTPSSATKEAPFINSLGMKFVPVPGTDILLCIHETRRQDYTVYSNEVSTVDTTWKDVKDHLQLVGGEPDHPVVAVSWNEAREYLRWLSVKERRVYRLPTDREWSNAVGIAEKENRGPGVTPRQLFETVPQDYPWGGLYPPSQGSLAGNYGDITYRERTDPRAPTIFEDYRDGFATTAPVMSFKPNKLGLYDLGGNVWEWVDDLFDAGPEALRVMRGGSYQGNDAFRNMTASSGRRAYGTTKHLNFCGFRVALDLKGSQ